MFAETRRFMLPAVASLLLFSVGRAEEPQPFPAGVYCITIKFPRMLPADAIEKAKRVLPKAVFTKELIELIFEQPYCKIHFVENAGIAKRLTATKYLRALEKAGFVVAVKKGTELIFINNHL